MPSSFVILEDSLAKDEVGGGRLSLSVHAGKQVGVGVPMLMVSVESINRIARSSLKEV